MMKTTEFVKKVEALGYEVGSFKTDMNICDSDGHELAIVSKKHRFVMDTNAFDFVTYVNDEDTEKLATLLFEYSATPIADREEEKRYRVKFPGIKRDGKNIYIMRTYNSDGTQGIDWSPEEYIFNDYPGAYLFTEKEIKSMNEHYWHFAEEVEG